MTVDLAEPRAMLIEVASERRTDIPLEVADIFNQYWEAYAASNSVTARQQRGVEALRSCRTVMQGGHRRVCGTCGYEEQA